MPKINLDNLEYNSEDLSERGLAVLNSLQFVEKRLREIELQLAMQKTAKTVYAQSLVREIKAADLQPVEIVKTVS